MKNAIDWKQTSQMGKHVFEKKMSMDFRHILLDTNIHTNYTKNKASAHFILILEKQYNG